MADQPADQPAVPVRAAELKRIFATVAKGTFEPLYREMAWRYMAFGLEQFAQAIEKAGIPETATGATRAGAEAALNAIVKQARHTAENWRRLALTARKLGDKPASTND
jgi:hypothetical protein